MDLISWSGCAGFAVNVIRTIQGSLKVLEVNVVGQRELETAAATQIVALI
jgi:hypothetical protein